MPLQCTSSEIINAILVFIDKDSCLETMVPTSERLQEALLAISQAADCVKRGDTACLGTTTAGLTFLQME